MKIVHAMGMCAIPEVYIGLKSFSLAYGVQMEGKIIIIACFLRKRDIAEA